MIINGKAEFYHKAKYLSILILTRDEILGGFYYEFGPSVFYLFGPLVKNLVLRFSIYSVLRIRSSVPARRQLHFITEKV